MSSGEIFVTFVLPATVVALAWVAVVANERAVRRAVEREKHAPGE